MGHFLENTGAGTLRFLEIFRSDRFAELSLARWLAQTPPELVAAHLGEAGRRLNGELTDKKRPVRPRQGPR